MTRHTSLGHRVRRVWKSVSGPCAHLMFCTSESEMRLEPPNGAARRRTDAAIFFLDEVLVRKLLVVAVAPFLTDPFVQVFGKGLRQTIGQRFGHDGVVIVVVGLEFLDEFFQTETAGDGEGTQMIVIRVA